MFTVMSFLAVPIKSLAVPSLSLRMYQYGYSTVNLIWGIIASEISWLFLHWVRGYLFYCWGWRKGAKPLTLILSSQKKMTSSCTLGLSLNFLSLGIVNISFQSAGTGKYATPTRNLNFHFALLAVSYELYPRWNWRQMDDWTQKYTPL